ncbi:MAG: DUF5050 domain-containing protein, partial [Chloroflexi bacterium]|nr:DUF5050 domain-containing protein [Chloroflexota bacterium]
MKRVLTAVLLALTAVTALGLGGYTGAAQGQTSVTIASGAVAVGETGVIEGLITCGAPGCGGFSITITYDPAIISVTSVEVGPYLGEQVFIGENTVADGRARLVAAALAAPPAEAGNVLFRLNVTGLAEGTATLHIEELEVGDLAGSAVLATGFDGTVTVGGSVGTVGFPDHPDWELVFVSERDGNPEIYAMNADGSNLRRLTDNPAPDRYPTWSPGGGRIAFVSERDGNAEIYVMDADGSNVQRLTADPAADMFPAWSPDGSEIAFVATRDGNAEVYVMSADGTNARRLTTDPSSDSYPAWAPFRNEIAFVSNRGGANEVYVMNSDGSNPQQMTNLFGANGWYPAWSPNGRQLSFTAERDAMGQIYAMDTDTSNARELGQLDNHVGRTDWSGDALWIAFVSARDGNSELYVMDASGQYEYRLTDETASDYWPDWRPIAAAPCLVSTDQPEVSVHVGPGENRAIFTFMPLNRDFLVTGQAVDDENNLWWQLDKTQFEDTEAVNELWVKADDVNEINACAAVPRVDAPPLIPGNTPPGSYTHETLPPKA